MLGVCACACVCVCVCVCVHVCVCACLCVCACVWGVMSAVTDLPQAARMSHHNGHPDQNCCCYCCYCPHHICCHQTGGPLHYPAKAKQHIMVLVECTVHAAIQICQIQLYKQGRGRARQCCFFLAWLGGGGGGGGWGERERESMRERERVIHSLRSSQLSQNKKP